MPRVRLDDLPIGVRRQIEGGIVSGVSVGVSEGGREVVIPLGSKLSHRSKFGKAKRTTIGAWRYDSKMEATVGERLRREYGDDRIVLHAKFPLVRLFTAARSPMTFSPDFLILSADRSEIERIVEAKPRSKGARSRDYELRKREFEDFYGATVEETDR